MRTELGTHLLESLTAYPFAYEASLKLSKETHFPFLDVCKISFRAQSFEERQIKANKNKNPFLSCRDLPSDIKLSHSSRSADSGSTASFGSMSKTIVARLAKV